MSHWTTSNSRVAVTGVAALGWNDTEYDPDRTLYFVAHQLAHNDPAATEALLTFFDAEHLAPTFGSQPWQAQSPRLKAVLEHARDAIANQDAVGRQGAISDVLHYADQLENAPDIISSGAVDADFAHQSRPWLEAMRLWGRALHLTALGLGAANQGSDTANAYFAEARLRKDEAMAVKTIAGATRFDGPIKLADGVLDTFINDATTMIAVKAK